MTVLVVAPEVPFESLDRELSELGWFLASESQEPPTIEGEPELATYTHRQADARLTYTFNPAVKLRVLAFAGAAADVARERGRVARRLEVLDDAALRKLLTSSERRSLLLGLFAAGAARDWRVVGDVERLTEHEHEAVARTAKRVLNQLRSLTSEDVLDFTVAEEPAPVPAGTMFRALGGVEMRRQVLRWLLREGKPLTPSVEQTLQAALRDPDEEVRLTAKLVGERLRAAEANAKAGTPKTGGRTSGQEASPPHDDRTLLTYALTTPLLPAEGPQQLPPALEPDGAGCFRLKRSGLILCWVGPVDHWLGQGTQIHLGRSPGFFAAREPLVAALASWALGGAINDSPLRRRPEGNGEAHDKGDSIGDAGRAARLAGKEARTHLCSREEAHVLVATLAQLEGVGLALPTPEQWEMAARGTDGRRFPWGNRDDLTQKGLHSPWGCERMVGGAPEWTTEDVVCGGPRAIPCAQRLPAAAVTHAAVRLVLLG